MRPKQRGFRKLGITGTKYTMEGPVYPEKLGASGIDYVVPNADERERIDRIIFDELVNGIFTDESRSYFQQVIARLQGQGCDAVVLGCTEIPLIIDDSTSRCRPSTRPAFWRERRSGELLPGIDAA